MFMSVALRFLENVCFVIKIFPNPSRPYPFSSKHIRYVFNSWVMVLGDPTPSQVASKFRPFVGWFRG